MRLFFKHLIRSIKKRPMQPLILVLTLALSIAVTISALSLKSALVSEERLAIEAKYGRADIAVSLNSTSQARFMFTEDVAPLIEGAVAAGYYEALVSIAGSDRVVFAAAADFYEIGNIYSLEFIEYKTINEDNLLSSILISKSFAEKNSLSAGDRLDTVIFGEERSYMVSGISHEPFVGSYDIMLDIRGVMKALAADSALAAVIGEDFRPSGTLLIKLPDGMSVGEGIDRLLSSDAFADKTVEDVWSRALTEENTRALGNMVNFSIVICCLVAMAVAFSCFLILAGERSEENEVFFAAGATHTLLNLMQYLEVLLYWAVGSVLGSLLSIPLTLAAKKYIGFEFADMSISPILALLGCALLLISLLLTVTAFVFMKRRKRRQKNSPRLLFTLLALSAALYLCIFLLPAEFRQILGIALAICLFLLVFVSASPVFRGVCGFADRKMQGLAERCGASLYDSLRYALKNARSVRALRGVTSLVALLVSAVMAVGVLVLSAGGNIELSSRVVSSDYLVINGTAGLYDKIDSRDSVSSLHRIYMSAAVHDNNMKSNIVSVSSPKALGEAIPIHSLPSGNEAAISLGEAKMLSLDVGDTFSVTVNEREIELRVSDIIDTGIYLVLFDCESFGIDYNMLLPERREGKEESDFLLDLSRATADEVASVVAAGEFMEEALGMFGIYIRCGNILLWAILLFALIGLLNTLKESYRSRKEEFSLYLTAGMSKRGLLSMKSFEISVSVLLGAAVGLLGFCLLLPVLREMMFSIGYNLFANLRFAF